MTRENAKQLLPVITAFGEGKIIEYYSKLEKRWITIGEDHVVDFTHEVDQYRIKRVPRNTYRLEFVDGILGSSSFNTEESAREYALHNYRADQFRIVCFVEQMPT
jgi:hypothetical protein